MTTMAPAGLIVRWRATLFSQIIGWGFAAVMLVSAVYVAANVAWGLSRIGLVAWFLVVGGVFMFMVSARVDLYPDRVVLAGPLRRRREIALARLKAVEPGRYGLLFRTGPAEGISGPASVGGKNLALQALRYHNRGDRIAETIMRQAAQVTHSASQR